MKELLIQREPSTEAETMGRLSWYEEGGVVQIHCVEQEWRPTHPGGQPNNSCVPAGRYECVKHIRPNGDEVLALVNPGHAVYYEELDRTNEVGRFLILLHSGNTSKDVIGCIAPGLSRTDNFVGSSRKAMKKIMEWLDGEEVFINITWQDGEPE
jgi:hypothetical protein